MSYYRRMTIATTSGRLVPEFTVGDRLRKARETAGYNEVQKFAEVIGVHRDTIARAERGSTPPKFPVLAAYSLATGVDLEWLKTGECTPWDLNPEPTDSGFELIYGPWSPRLELEAVAA